MDRTQIEMPPEPSVASSPQQSASSSARRMPAEANVAATGGVDAQQQEGRGGGVGGVAEASHNAKPTLRPLSDFLTEDPMVYNQDEIKEMLDMIHDGNRMRDRPGAEGSRKAGGGLKPLVRAYGICGFIRFLEGYYLTLITKRAKVGQIGGNGIYTIKSTESIPLKPADRGPLTASDADQADPSSVLLSMWNRGKRQIGLGLTGREIAELRYQGLYQVVDLTKNFYFSYTYDLTRSLQENFLSATSQPFPPPPFKDVRTLVLFYSPGTRNSGDK
jgi:hypothetical protein